MHSAHTFLEALAMVLCVAAVTTVLFQKLRQPVVLGYILAGLIIGPHVPIPLVADQEVVQTMSELGVILLMFSLGLEFSLRKLAQVGPSAGFTAVMQSSVMVWLGFISARALGWSMRESLFTGAIVAISSTTIIVRAFAEQRVVGKLRELVVGVLIVEDLIAIALMAMLTGLARGEGLSAGALAATMGKLSAVLAGFLCAGMVVVPRMMRAIVKLGRSETTLVASVGLCFATALLAQQLGYSAALGAFLCGSLIAESGEGRSVELLIEPVRDMFAAIFFVSVGMMIDPGVIIRYWPAIALLSGVVIAGKIVSVALSAFLSGNGIRTSLKAGMSLAQIGEFSFIIAGLGLSSKATREFLYPVAVAVSAVTTLTTPWLIRAADPAAKFVDRHLPRPLQTFASLYGSWLERLRAGGSSANTSSLRRLVSLLLLDAAALTMLIIGTAVGAGPLAERIRESVGGDARLAHGLVVGAATLVALPFCIGIVRLTHQLGISVATVALPASHRGVDLAAAPRRVLALTLQLGATLLIGAPIVALTQPFVPGAPTALLLALVLAVLGISFFRGATNLQGHVRAGAQAIVEALATQSRAESPRSVAESLAEIDQLLPGLGELVPVKLVDAGRATGHSLAELNLRGLTGATVMAITRGNESILLPTAEQVLCAGDVVVLAGAHDAVAAAAEVLNER